MGVGARVGGQTLRCATGHLCHTSHLRPLSADEHRVEGEAATLCGCNPVWPRLQPCVAQTATLCGPDCNPMWTRLQP